MEPADWQSFLSERRVAVVATNGADGLPHAVPVEVLVEGGKVYVWCRRTSRKARNVERDGRASLVGYKGNDGVLVRGAARLLSAEDQRYEALTAAFLWKYARDETYGNDVLIEIDPEHVTTFG